MNGSGHCKKFKRLHKAGMSVTTIEKGRFTSSNGNHATKGLQEVGHLPDRLPWKLRLKSRLIKASGLVVRKQSDGNYSISRPVAGIFISAFLSMMVAGGLGLLSQRDEIVRLRTLQEVQDKTNADMMSKIDQAKNTAMIADRNSARIEGKFDQFAQVYSIKNADKAKLEINPE